MAWNGYYGHRHLRYARTNEIICGLKCYHCHFCDKASNPQEHGVDKYGYGGTIEVSKEEWESRFNAK
jgi:hypothetical protein